VSPPPVLVRGTFAEVPLPELLIALLDRQLAGTLVIQESDGSKSALLIVRGAPAKARLAHNPIFLGETLVEIGVLDEEARKTTLQEALGANRPHGQVLLSQGFVDDGALFVGLREQLHRQTLALCELPPETAFGLYPANYLDGWGPSPEWRVKPLPLVWQALAQKAPLSRVDHVVSRLGGRELRMRFEAPVARYRLEQSELALVNVLRAKPQPIAQLQNSGVGSEERVRRAVYALVMTRQLDLSAEQGLPVGHQEPPESPQSILPPALRPQAPAQPRPRAGSPSTPASSDAGPRHTTSPASAKRSAEEVQAFRREVEERERRGNIGYYEQLGVEPNADIATIRSAFFQLAKRWHPDRLTEELADLREVVTRTFAHMGEAHQVLSDEDQRRRYDEVLKNGGMDEQEQVMAVVRAAGAFQKAEVLVKKRDFARALIEAQAAYDGDPEQAEYAALYAWLSARELTHNFEEPIGILDRAVEREPDNVRVRWYRGQLLKKIGHDGQAMRDFKHIVTLKPHHVEALREIRLHDMRKQSDPHSKKGSDPKMRRTTSQAGMSKSSDPNAKKSGMFGKWLKK
jgi:curved DNA-binding protein CbpA